MSERRLNCLILSELEARVEAEFNQFYGMGRGGFCDFSRETIDLMLEVLYRRRVHILTENGDYRDFNDAIRDCGYYHFNSAIHQLRSTYHLVSKGYYSEAAILVRSNVESFVRLKYLNIKQDVHQVKLALAGHTGVGGKKFRVSYEQQFNTVAPGLYRYYRFLCDIAHGAMTAEMMRWDLDVQGHPSLAGVEFREKHSSLITNQVTFYSLAQLHFLKVLYPESFEDFSQGLKDLYQRTIEITERALQEFHGMNPDGDMMQVVQTLIVS